MNTDFESNSSPEQVGKRAPVRYFDYPLFTDPWFLFGLVLFGTSIALIISLYATNDLLGFMIRMGPNLTSAEIAPIAREALQVVLTILVVAWVLPPTVRLWQRKQRLRDQAPDSATPEFLSDPVYRECQRYWTGTEWSQYVKPERRITWAKNLLFILVGAVAFVTIQLIGAQPAINSLSVIGTYMKSVEVYSQYIDNLPPDLEAQPWNEYAMMNIAVAPEFANAAQDLKRAVNKLNGEGVDGIPANAMNQYSLAYSRWAFTLKQVAQGFEQCSLSDEQCLIDSYDPLAEQFTRDWDNLIAESDALADL